MWSAAKKVRLPGQSKKDKDKDKDKDKKDIKSEIDEDVSPTPKSIAASPSITPAEKKLGDSLQVGDMDRASTYISSNISTTIPNSSFVPSSAQRTISGGSTGPLRLESPKLSTVSSQQQLQVTSPSVQQMSSSNLEYNVSFRSSPAVAGPQSEAGFVGGGSDGESDGRSEAVLTDIDGTGKPRKKGGWSKGLVPKGLIPGQGSKSKEQAIAMKSQLDELNRKNQELESQVDNLNTMIQTKDVTMGLMKDEIQKLEEEAVDLKRTLGADKDSAGAPDAAVDELKNKLQASTTESDTLRARVKELEEEKQQLLTEREQLLGEKANLQQELEGLKEEIAQLKSQHVDLNTSFGTPEVEQERALRIQAEAELEVSKSEINNLKKRIEELDSSPIPLSRPSSVKDKDEDKWTTDLQNLKQKYKEETETLRVNLMRLEKEKELAVENLTKYQAEQSAAAASEREEALDSSRLKSELQEAKSALAQLEAEKRNIQNDLETQRLTAVKFESQNVSLTRTLEDLKANETILKSQLVAKRAGYDKEESERVIVSSERERERVRMEMECEKLNDKMRAANQELSEMRQNLTEKEGRLADEQMKIRSLEMKISDYESKMNEQKSKASNLESDLARLRSTSDQKLSTAESALQKLQDSFNQKSQELIVKVQELEVLKMKYNVIEESYKDAHTQLKSLSEGKNEFSTQMNARENTLNREILELQGTRNLLAQQVEGLQQSQSQMKSENEKLRREKDVIADELLKAKNEFSSANLQLELNETRLKHLKEENADLRETNKELHEASAEVLQDRLKTGQAATAEIQNMKMRVQQLENEKEELHKDQIHLKSQTEELERTKTKIRVDYDKLLHDFESTKTENGNLSSKLAELEIQTASLKASVNDAFKRENQLQSEMALMKKQNIKRLNSQRTMLRGMMTGIPEAGTSCDESQGADPLNLTSSENGMRKMGNMSIALPLHTESGLELETSQSAQSPKGPPAAIIYSDVVAGGERLEKEVRTPDGNMPVVWVMKDKLVEAMFETFGPRPINPDVLGGVFKQFMAKDPTMGLKQKLEARPEVIRVLSRVQKLWMLSENLRLALVQLDPGLASRFQATVLCDWNSVLDILKSSASIVETRNAELEKLVASYSAAITECKTVATLDKEKAKAIIQNLKKQLQKSEQLRLTAENEKDMLLRDQAMLHESTQQVLFDQAAVQRQIHGGSPNPQNVVHIVPVPSVMPAQQQQRMFNIQQSADQGEIRESPFLVRERCPKGNRLVGQPVRGNLQRDNREDYGTPASTGEWQPPSNRDAKSKQQELEAQWRAQQHQQRMISSQQKTVMPDPTQLPQVVPQQPSAYPKAAVARGPPQTFVQAPVVYR